MKKKMISKVFFIFIIVLCSMKIIGSYTIFTQIDEEVKNEMKTSELTLNCVPAETELTLYKQDFQFIKPYSNTIHYYTYVSENDLKHKYFLKTNDKYYPNLYCLNDSLKETYQISDLKDNQIVLSSSYLNFNDFSNYKENETISFLNEEYELVKIVENDFENIAIVNDNSYKKYGDINTYQKVIVELSSLQQRTKLYTQKYQEMAKLKEKCYISDIYFDMNIEEKNSMVQENESSFDSMSIIIVSIAVAITIIYVYQFSFELFKQKEDIGSYQLLGLSKREIKNIYFYKSLIIGSVGMFFGGLYYYLECYYSLNMLSYEYIMYIPLNILLLIIIPFIIVVLIVAISLIPLRRILKLDGLENKNTRE